MKIVNIVITALILIRASNIYCNDFFTLQTNYKKFITNICPFPTINNTINAIANNNKNKQNQIIAYAKDSYPIIDDTVIELCKAFLIFKKNNGTTIEQSLYKNMSLSDFIIRLLEKRPLVFMNPNDDCKLRYPTAQLKPMNFTKIGTQFQQKPLILNDYLSYDEMKIAALIGLSSPTCFINNGNRNNASEIGQQGTFQEEGIYVGLVGARFEKENFMEWQDIIITKEQNDNVHGYGLTQCNQGLLKIWSDFYEIKFPSYAQAASDTTGIYIPYGQNFFNTMVYKKRIACVMQPFLQDANKRGKKLNKKAYVHIVGLGLGVWVVLQQEQTKCIIEVCKEIINNNDFSYITDLDFSWFGNNADSLVTSMQHGSTCSDKNNNAIAIHFSKRNPADKLVEINKDKLLVACYAWDGNAYPGNEYWAHKLTATGDPAAACCSLIATLQNILINPWLTENIVTMYGARATSNIKQIKIIKSKPVNFKTRLKSFINSGLSLIGYDNYFNID